MTADTSTLSLDRERRNHFFDDFPVYQKLLEELTPLDLESSSAVSDFDDWLTKRPIFLGGILRCGLRRLRSFLGG